MANRVVSMLPPHGHYVEPYAGGLAVLLAKPVSRMETVNDIDGDLMFFWKMLRDRPVDLARVCALTPHSRAEHSLSRDRDHTDDLERARRIWVALSQSRGGQLTPTGWRHHIAPSGSSVGMPGYLDGYVKRIAPAAARLKHVSLESRPAIEVIAAYGRDADTLLYVDPPYLGATRGATHAYQHEMRDPAQHTELAEALKRCKGPVVLSGYPSSLYDELYSDWYHICLPAFTGQGNQSPTARGARVEILWSNRPLNKMLSLLDKMPLDTERTGQR
ncbi:MAG: DNA adenine methylase [Nocardioidaceae bacterium]|nr:MAG: DNA adenine methylase [Nocardioidaceae bacterium]